MKTLPFFALIGLGYGAGRTGFFSKEAIAYLTKFVFYFALSAMLFRFAARLSLGEVFDWTFVGAYVLGTFFVYAVAALAAWRRGLNLAEMAFEAHASIVGNVGFLGVPMLVLLLGEAAIGPIILVLAMDLTVFGTLVVVLVSSTKDRSTPLAAAKSAFSGLIRNPMIVAITLGLCWSGFNIPMWQPLDDFVTILGAAATPGALVAIGASLSTIKARGLVPAFWLGGLKLFLHPLAVAVAALWVFGVEPFAASVMIACAALPVAGNVYILAQHYEVAPQKISASILISTIASVATVSIVIALLKPISG
ncbi:AEC family transporter [Maritalea mediterranea]|uniref:AEC family transporter n=1 Tax=Maritalea mediterranea TaxID=2909667 RepID=A0ABS9EAM9_9HYPH|nr:AEC family transporter [Maritalea mediterranea]MCF4098478.1 AEC family transporter [Maritalea mediterranea]